MTSQPPALGQPNKQLSIISLVLGILSITVCWLAAAIPAVITGHIAMNRMRRSPSEYGGKGMATGGLVMGYLSIVVSLTLIPASLLLPALAKAKSKAQRIACVNNLKQVMLAANMYAQENQRRFPASFLAMSNELSSPKFLICPAERQKKQPSYDWANFSEEDTSYEFIAPGLNNANASEPVPAVRCPIHNNIGMSDGSVQMNSSRRSISTGP